MTTDLTRLKALPLPLHIDEEFNIIDVNKKVILQTAYIDLLDGWITKDLVNALNTLPEMISELDGLRSENIKLKTHFKQNYFSELIKKNVWQWRAEDGGPFAINDLTPEQTGAQYAEWGRMAEEALQKLLEA